MSQLAVCLSGVGVGGFILILAGVEICGTLTVDKVEFK